MPEMTGAVEREDTPARLKTDCGKCSGLCCVALYCAKADGLPADRRAGVPCAHLTEDFRCDMHAALTVKGMRGCTAYDCFGAGQRVTRELYPRADWRSAPERAEEIFGAFHTMFRLHQMEWYLYEARARAGDAALKAEAAALIAESERLARLPAAELAAPELERHQTRVNAALKRFIRQATDGGKKPRSPDHIGRSLRRARLERADLSLSLLIAADMEGCSLRDACLLGADMRDANIKNTDLSSCLFLTQMQINSARGNGNTQLPPGLSRPAHWPRD